MHEEIMESGDHLRVRELQEEKIQFTDATNAERLFRENKRDVRYLTAWKKWLVWNGTRANGKSTFLNTIMYLLSDYAISTERFWVGMDLTD